MAFTTVAQLYFIQIIILQCLDQLIKKKTFRSKTKAFDSTFTFHTTHRQNILS